VAVSDYVYQRPMVIYFNKNMIRDYKLEDPYELVNSGNWTWDKLAEMSAAVAEDLNGDGKYDEDDQYGFSICLDWQPVTVVHANGMFLTGRDSDGYPLFTPFATEKMKNVIDKFYDLLYAGNKTYIVKRDTSVLSISGYTPLFGQGQILFCYSNTQLLQHLNDITLDFGMIPLPKYDTRQDGYYVLGDTQMMVVPADVYAPEMSSVIAEALSAYSWKRVVPAVYDVLYANQYMRDEQSYEMFNLIRKGIVYDFAWTFGEGGSMTYALVQLMMNQNTNITSYYEKNASAQEKTMKKFIEKVMND